MHMENKLRPTKEKPAFITMKDQKENVQDNTKRRQINPERSERECTRLHETSTNQPSKNRNWKSQQIYVIHN